jgi:hypothetical protein
MRSEGIVADAAYRHRRREEKRQEIVETRRSRGESSQCAA